MYTVITIFLSCILVNSFISTHKFCFFSQFFPSSHWEGGMSERLCGAQSPAGLNHNSQIELPARLNHNSQIDAQHGTQKVEIMADLTGAC